MPRKPRLVAIKTPIKDHDPRIKRGQLYLFHIDDEWGMGRAEKEWYGWNFEGVYTAGVQHDWIDKIYELHL